MRNTTSVLAVASLCVVVAACAQTGGSQSEEDNISFPERAIKLVIPFAPGSSTDVVGRVMAECYERQLGQAVTVENRDGGSGSIGMTEAAQAKPDGYTLVYGSTSSSTLTPALNADVTYDIESFAPIGAVTVTPSFIVVAKDSPYDSLKDLVEAGQGRTLAVIDSGITTISGVSAEGLATNYGLQIKHVPATSIAEIRRGLEQGDFDFGVGNVSPDTVPWIVDKQMKVLGIAADETPEWAADTPTMKSAGYGDGQLPGAGNLGFIAAPVGTNAAILEKLEETNKSCVQDETVMDLVGTEVLAPEGLDRETLLETLRQTAIALNELGPTS
ncbi:tripartite tricarboxylate transporter substrate binding protein [Rhodococcus fascians]|nr:tripartite tricarboxylate transporter substrate binding protein [Rhodococcus fascians]MBY3998486.1 tripartite tricarboxylate transporter substrate binding protein [Rhodococcus fascians]MBY4004520.1 tripartite tricarboxylate transporter substrate binding protein [Rhodococcus fascians]MBY4009299.1 tripartite tricarboxylate transporter substrate binding protein [Rhodococcus fascians]MBY4019727.1 tripartite tricarboxylate transporter substrate binding protein [Rhodococcus fascians]